VVCGMPSFVLSPSVSHVSTALAMQNTGKQSDTKIPRNVYFYAFCLIF
jgi:hypothetical protein